MPCYFNKGMKRGFKVFGQAAFFMLVLVVLLMTASIGFVVVPLLVIFNNFLAYAIAIILGLAMGSLVNRFVHDLEDLTHHHHATLWIIVLLSSILNFSAVYMGLSLNNPFWSVDVSLNIAMSGALVFTTAFFVPLFVEMLHLSKKEVR